MDSYLMRKAHILLNAPNAESARPTDLMKTAQKFAQFLHDAVHVCDHGATKVPGPAPPAPASGAATDAPATPPQARARQNA
jgi:hypothetical protein